MAALINHLQHMVARGDSELDLVRAIEEELTGGDLLDDELEDGLAAMAMAARREAELQSRLAGLAARMASDHVRRAELTRTLIYAQRGGLYLPSELRALGEARGLRAAAGEAVRFSAFTVVVEQVIARMEQRRIHAEDYASAVTELASRLSRVPIGRPALRR